MNATNRGLGRTALVVVGLALLVLGVAAVLVQTLPWAADRWHTLAPVALADLGADADRAASVTAWTWVLGGAVVLGVLALVVLSSLGGGRVGTVLEDDGAADGVPGVVRVEAAAVQHALSSAIGALPQVASLAVDVYRVRGVRAVRIRVRPRRGAAPREITTRVEQIVADLDALLGERLPVLLEIARGGAGSARADRVH
uniref:Alkaline shock response membrane anchor protein AmaP n=1 Tax=Neobacillus citreus TaxID=2833578 RepID=A0A942SXX4_9BACI